MFSLVFMRDCQSCNQAISLEENFCSNCGDKAFTDRISTNSLLKEMVSSVFSWDNTFWKTFRDLFTKPEEVIKTYLSGARKVVMNPFKIYALILTISLLFQSIFFDQIVDFLYVDFDTETNPVLKNDAAILETLQAYSSFTAFLFMPFYGLLSYWVFRKPYNYGEHIVINFYAFVPMMVINLVALLLALLLNLGPLYFITAYIMYPIIILIFYQRLYKLSAKRFMLKAFKLITLGAVSFIIMVILIIIIMFLYDVITKTEITI